VAPSRKKLDGTKEKQDALLGDVVNALLADTVSRRKKSTRKTSNLSSKKVKESDKSIKPLPISWKGGNYEDDPTDADKRLAEFMRGERTLTEKDGTLHTYQNDGRCYKLEEIGQVMGVTRERVRQIEEHALRKMWRLIRSMNLREDLTEGDWLDILAGGHPNEDPYGA